MDVRFFFWLFGSYTIVNGYVYQRQAVHDKTHLLDLRDVVYPEFREELSREYENRLRREAPASWPDFREAALPAYLSVTRASSPLMTPGKAFARAATSDFPVRSPVFGGHLHVVTAADLWPGGDLRVSVDLSRRPRSS